MLSVTMYLDPHTLELEEHTSPFGVQVILRVANKEVSLNAAEADELHEALGEFLKERGRC